LLLKILSDNDRHPLSSDTFEVTGQLQVISTIFSDRFIIVAQLNVRPIYEYQDMIGTEMTALLK